MYFTCVLPNIEYTFGSILSEANSNVLELLHSKVVYFWLIDYYRNKSWNPGYIGSFNMDWWILVFYPEPEDTC